ncbi:MAG: hypothetical protein H5U01_04775 [Clostridia bacterium]|nr:hypothetical protein [Clostridia bacterium]
MALGLVVDALARAEDNCLAAVNAPAAAVCPPHRQGDQLRLALGGTKIIESRISAIRQRWPYLGDVRLSNCRGKALRSTSSCKRF